MSSEPHDTDAEAPSTTDRASGDLLAGDLGRWRVLERIGSGGMGVVYRAVDSERGSTVAVKMLHRTDPGGLLRLKAEFRAVAHLAHENLAMLHELVVEGDRWFFVMEYVDGESFLEHVRDLRADAAGAVAVDMAVERARQAETLVGGSAALAGWVPVEVARPLDPGGERRLREAMRQLARGVCALHAGGKLHRDLKPSNVLVARDGRVVILDFGLVTDDSLASRAHDGPTAGTPAYMAPEQALGRPTTQASDWYAVGVMLFEALTGHLPFRGGPRELLESKVRHEAFPPSAVIPSVPEDLDTLCADLLRIDPAARPAGHEVLQRLGASPTGGSAERDHAVSVGSFTSFTSSTARWADEPSRPTELDADAGAPHAVSGERLARAPVGSSDSEGRGRGSHPPPPMVIGRESELDVLRGAFRDAAAGDAVAVLVDGPSGVGKTALVRSFADDLRRHHGALVLEGRCYERESVPYKAFDALVDALERELGALPRERLADLLPPGLNALARIFPVLREVAVLSSDAAGSVAGPDPQELQARAFRCLKLLLARLAGARPLVLVIDDLQWGDGDSGRLLGELLTQPDRPAMLLVCTYRSDEAETPLLRAIQAGELLEGVRPLHVRPLGALDARELARTLLAPGVASEAAVSAIAREADGIPFFVEQLVRYAEAGGSDNVSLGGLLAARVTQLPADARRLLEVVAVAGRPIEQGVAAAAAGLLDARPALSLLRSGSLVRTRGARPGDAVEAYHDRIRKSVSAELDASERARIHLALAAALESTAGVDRRDLALHLHAGGDLSAAFAHAVLAADEAAAGLAFDRAAELYQLAIGCAQGSIEERATLQARAANALVHAGRCAEAAPLYLAASSGRTGDAAWDLRRQAAEQLLVSGDIDAGVRVLRPVLADVGLPFPASPRTALASAIGRVAQIELRALLTGGLSARAQREADSGLIWSPARAPAIELRRFDACWSAGKGLLSVDPVRGAYFFLRALVAAASAGDPNRLARSLAIYGMLQVFEGDARGHARGSRVLTEAAALAQGLDDPYLRGMMSTCRGTASMSIGRWREGLELMEAGIAELEQRCTDATWDLGVGRSSCFNTRLWMGEVRVIAETAPTWHRAAERVGNRFAEVTSDLYTAFGELAGGNAADARRRVHGAIGRWTRSGFHFQHWLALKVDIWCDLYEERPEAAWARLEEAWPKLEDSNLLRVQLMTIDCLLLRGLVAAATARADTSRLDLALRNAVTLEKLGRPTALAASRLLRGQVELARGRLDPARVHLDAAVSGFEAADVQLHAECARRRLGELRGGDMGRALVARVDRWMTQQGIVDPARFAGVFAPVPSTRVHPIDAGR